jgi:hypothetical protein
VGAEQNDLVRPEVLGDLACETADDAHGNIGTAMPAGGSTIGSSPGLGSAVWKSPAFGFHALIVPGAQAGCYGQLRRRSAYLLDSMQFGRNPQSALKRDSSAGSP